MLGNLGERILAAGKSAFRTGKSTVRGNTTRRNRLRLEPLEHRLMLDAGPLIISEFLARNDDVLADVDGDFPDWIEIHNPTGSAVSLDGWYLTDDTAEMSKWEFPDETLAPGGYLVVFASGKDRDVAGAELHTSFVLDGDGEYLALVRPDAVTVSHSYVPKFPDQHDDVSYGVTQDISHFVADGAGHSYIVPTSADNGLDWTDVDFDDSAWTSTVPMGGSGLKITEIDNGATSFVEIQNVWDQDVHPAGWLVAVNNGLSGNINSVNSTVWSLPTTIPAGAVLYKTDNGADNYWGSDIQWNSDHGWVMIVDNGGNVADFLPWGYTSTEITSMSVNVGPFSGISIGNEWNGAAPAGMGNGWQTNNSGEDIGGPLRPGSHSYNSTSGVYTVNGGGADIWSTADQFYFAHQTISGDTEIIAKVNSVENTNAWAKAGVMIRESTTANSKHAFVAVTPGNGVAFQGRVITGNQSFNTPRGGLSAPHWVKLVRTGNTFTGYESADGATWSLIGSQNITMGTDVEVGLAVTSHNDSTLCTATFQNVSAGMPLPADRYQRTGELDHNTAADFIVPDPASNNTVSKGVQNDDLVLPFPGGDQPLATGIGYNQNPSGFNVDFYKANVIVGDLSVAEDVIADPAKQADSANETVGVINYFNTGGDPHFGNNRPFPTTTINIDVDDFVIEAIATILIPRPGEWTFGVNSDDGFSLDLAGAGGSFQISYPNPRGPSDTLGVFNVTQAGAYDLRLVFYERGGGSGVELFAAEGNHAAFNASFAMIGDTDNGGLAVTGFGGAIRTDVEADMYNVNSSLWTRIPFTVDDLSGLDSLQLRMMYNDGFVAYLNGQEVARGNAPAVLRWNSIATVERSYEESAAFETFNVTTSIPALLVGENILAIRGLNSSTTDEEFLVLPELTGSFTGDVERYFATPTPGGPNGEGFIDYVADTKFSVDRGFFDAPFDLEIITNTVGATIRYTIDGSEPTETNGSDYTGAIHIATTTVLRAAAFKVGYEPTNVDTQTYLFLDSVLQQPATPPAGWPAGSVNGQTLDYGMDPDIVNGNEQAVKDALTSIPTMSIVTDIDNLFNPSSGIYVNAGGDGPGWERPTSLELIYPPGAEGPGFPDIVTGSDTVDAGFQIDAGLRIRGGYSRQGSNPKHAFRLFFRNEYGAGKLNYALFGNEGVDQFDKVDLRTSQNYSWAFGGPNNNTMVREVFSRDVQGEMGQPYTRSRYYHLYLNGVYWGLFQTQERAGAHLAASYYGGDVEDYDTIKQSDGYEVMATDGNLDAYRRLWNATIAGYSSDAAYYRAQGLNTDGTRNLAYEKMLDVDNLIDYMIITYYTGDRDGPGSRYTAPRINNYYAVYNRENPDGWKFYEHDSEHSLGTGENDMVRPLVSAMAARAEFRYFNAHWLHEQLTVNQNYVDRFMDRVAESFYNDGVLTDENAIAKIDYRVAQIDSAIVAESARWGDQKTNPPRDYGDWLVDVSEVRNWITGRTNTVVSQIRAVGWYPNVDPPVFNQPGGHVASGFNMTLGGTFGTIYYTLNGTDPRLPDGSIHPDAEIFEGSTSQTTLVTQGSIWKYRDDGSNQGTAWRSPTFNDASWSSGPAELGYGDGGEATVLSYGPDAGNKYQTTYFRRKFDASDVSSFDSLILEIMRDDGAIVYLNGQEVARNNMTAGTVTYQTYASGVAGGGDESTFYTYSVDPALLVEGENTLAAEIHQANATSSDISFDLRLRGTSSSTSSPTQLTQSTLVMTRARQSNEWSPLSQAQFIVGEPASPSNLAIAEINYHPLDPTLAELAVDPMFVGSDFEFIELMNTSGQWLDLREASFTEMPEGIAFDFSSGAVLELGPGQRVVLVNNLGAFQTRYGNDPSMPIAGEYTGNLSNSGERLELLDWEGQPIDNFAYNDSGAWPGRADGKGASLELIDPGAVPTTEPLRTVYLEDGDNWRSSSEFGGSPGLAGEGPRGDIAINEVLSHTDPPDYDSIELMNLSGAEINISGWYLSDSSANYLKYEIPNGTVLQPGEYVVFNEYDHFNKLPLSANDFALNGAHGDDVWLVEVESGVPVRFVDHAEFDSAANGESFGRWPNGTGKLYPMENTSLGGANTGPRVGPIIISEVMYHPADPGGELDPNDFEFVEIHNPTGSAVDLTNWRIRKGIDYDFAAGSSLAAGATLVVVPFDVADAVKLAAFRGEYGIGGSVAIVGPYSGKLDDDGEKVQLQRPDQPPADEPEYIPHLLEDEVIYSDLGEWPTEPDGTGPSLHRFGADLWGNNPASWQSAAATPGSVSLVAAATIAGRHIFYDGSAFDDVAGADVNDSNAIAADKQPLLPGQKASFANYTSYVRGINGIMVDIQGLPRNNGNTGPGLVSAADFQFQAGNSNAPGSWATVADPSVSVQTGAGTDGSDRITLTWAAGEIQNKWLQVTVLGGGNTGLLADDVFYFGNAVGEAGDSPLHALINATDEIFCRNNQHGPFDPTDVTDAYDYNRDRIVNATDQIISRMNQTSPFNALRLITVPTSITEGASPAPLVSDSSASDRSDATDALLGELAWLFEAEAEPDQSTETGTAKETVDRLLATYWRT